MIVSQNKCIHARYEALVSYSFGLWGGPPLKNVQRNPLCKAPLFCKTSNRFYGGAWWQCTNKRSAKNNTWKKWEPIKNWHTFCVMAQQQQHLIRTQFSLVCIPSVSWATTNLYWDPITCWHTHFPCHSHIFCVTGNNEMLLVTNKMLQYVLSMSQEIPGIFNRGLRSPKHMMTKNT